MNFDKDKIKLIAEKYGLKLVVLFGSTAKGNTHQKSDLDLAFYPIKKVNEQKVYEEFVHLFRRADLDLVNLRDTHNHLLRYQILSQGIVLYEQKLGLKSRMEWQSYFDYVDFKKYYLSLGEMLDERLKIAVG